MFGNIKDNEELSEKSILLEGRDGIISNPYSAREKGMYFHVSEARIFYFPIKMASGH